MIKSETLEISGLALRMLRVVQKEYQTDPAEALGWLILAGSRSNELTNINFDHLEGVKHLATAHEEFEEGEQVGFKEGDELYYGHVESLGVTELGIGLTEATRVRTGRPNFVFQVKRDLVFKL